MFKEVFTQLEEISQCEVDLHPASKPQQSEGGNHLAPLNLVSTEAMPSSTDAQKGVSNPAYISHSILPFSDQSTPFQSLGPYFALDKAISVQPASPVSSSCRPYITSHSWTFISMYCSAASISVMLAVTIERMVWVTSATTEV